LCQIIERPFVDIRILGRSESVRVEARGTSLTDRLLTRYPDDVFPVARLER
jgi:hypothetical protein